MLSGIVLTVSIIHFVLFVITIILLSVTDENEATVWIPIVLHIVAFLLHQLLCCMTSFGPQTIVMRATHVLIEACVYLLWSAREVNTSIPNLAHSKSQTLDVIVFIAFFTSVGDVVIRYAVRSCAHIVAFFRRSGWVQSCFSICVRDPSYDDIELTLNVIETGIVRAGALQNN